MVHRYIYIPYGKKGKVRGKQRTPPRGQARPDGTRKSYGGWQGQRSPPGGQAETPTQCRQRPLPTRAPTRTSRRAGIGQGDLPHTKATTSLLRMQGDQKEQHNSYSLNQWKERFDLWHRHAGMLTGSEPYKLRGILSKEPRSIMTWLGPSPERGPRTQPIKY